MAKEKKSSAKRIEKPLNKLNSMFNDLMDNINNTNAVERDRELTNISKEVDDVISQEIEGLTQFTGEDISTFLTKLFSERDHNNAPGIVQTGDVSDLFESESGGVYSFFQERYRNTNLLYEDLNMISSQLYEIREAINTTRDAIVASDESTNSVSRVLTFGSMGDNDPDREGFIGQVEAIEKEFKLLTKVKNHIVPNTLQYGKYYVYTVPYSKLFQNHYDKNQKNTMKFGAALESVGDDFVKDFKKDVNIDTEIKDKSIKESFESMMADIQIINDEDVHIPVVEGSELSDLIEFKMDKARKRNKSKSNTPTDGTVDVNQKSEDFSNINDCYVKLIDPRKMIPIRILDETIGYYYIHEDELKVSKSPFTTSIKMSTNDGAKDVENAFLSRITDKIVKGFNRKFLEENSKFKKLILNSLIYNDIYKKELKFQFIPVDYITEFSVNHDEEGEGTSIIYPSLFYAKLYLALLIFKTTTIISKSNDQKVIYVKNSGVDTNVVNKIQEIARSMKERQVNFMDLMNYNSMVSKVGNGKDIYMPVGRSGERAIEFDILQGQDVQLNTELMESLRSAFISATGVPSVIMNYINEADYAKTLVMANNKFLQRVVSLQMDFNEPLTKLYKKIMLFSGISIDPEVIDEFTFSLNSPKTLDTMNMSDLINNSEQVMQFVIKALTGEQAPQTDRDMEFKDILYKNLAKTVLPMIPWDDVESIFTNSEIELIERLANAAKETPDE